MTFYQHRAYTGTCLNLLLRQREWERGCMKVLTGLTGMGEREGCLVGDRLRKGG